MCFVYVCDLLCRGNTGEGVASARSEQGKDTERHEQGAGSRGTPAQKKAKKFRKKFIFLFELLKKISF